MLISADVAMISKLRLLMMLKPTDDLHNDHVENLVSADPRLQDDRSQLDDQFMVVRNDQRMPQTFAAGHLIICRTYVDHLILFFW